MTRGLAPWSRLASSQSQQNREKAAQLASEAIDRFRSTGDWRWLVAEVVKTAAAHSVSSANRRLNTDLLAEALTRELETVSLEEILMRNLL